MKAFHAYDIRGIYNVDFDKNDAYKIGFFLPQLLKTNKILVGRDVRTSSPEIYEYLTNGITDAGADVYNIGLATTPMVYYATAVHKFDASVQITASHNPAEYNGMKISRTNALPVGYDTGLKELENLVLVSKVEISGTKGKFIDLDIRLNYLNFLKQYLTDFSNIKIGLDCSNGMAALLIKDILGEAPLYIYDELDGTFPNHEANPLIAKNVVDLQNLVKENNCDLGIIFDGDADRVMFVDDKARFVAPDLIIAVLGDWYFNEKGLKGDVLQDIRTSKSVTEYLQKYNAKVHTWKVGRAFAAHKLREIDGLYGGEFAGHYYFKEFFYSDSGILASLIVLSVVSKLKKHNIKFSELIDKIKIYENSGEINFKLAEKLKAMNAVRDYYIEKEKPVNFFDFDGYRIEYPDWWFNIRMSNTEPYLRLLVEAKDKNLLDAKVSEIKNIILSFA
jgi:phosphomannomutase